MTDRFTKTLAVLCTVLVVVSMLPAYYPGECINGIIDDDNDSGSNRYRWLRGWRHDQRRK